MGASGEGGIVGVSVEMLVGDVIVEALEGVEHIDTDHGLRPHRLGVGGQLVGADIVVLVAAPEVGVHGGTVIAHAVPPVVEGGKAPARPADDLGGDVLARLHRALLEAADGIRGGEGEVVADDGGVRRQEEGEGVAPLDGDGEGGLDLGVLVANGSQRAGHHGIFRSAFLVNGHGEPLTARELPDLTLEGVGHVGEAMLAVLGKAAEGVAVVLHLHGGVPMAGLVAVADPYVSGGGLLDDEGGIVLDELMPRHSGEGEPCVMLVARMVPVEHPPVGLTAGGEVGLVLQKVVPELVDHAVGVKGLEAAVEEHLGGHALHLQTVAQLDEVGGQLFADGGGVELGRGFQLDIHGTISFLNRLYARVGVEAAVHGDGDARHKAAGLVGGEPQEGADEVGHVTEAVHGGGG